MKNKKMMFSTLWVFVTFNYLYCDLIGLMDASLLKQYLTGHVEGMTINEPFLLLAGILMEIPISMIVLSQLLPARFNAIANATAGFIKTIVMIATLFAGHVSSYYLFFAIIEIGTTLFISIKAIQWLKSIKTYVLTYQA
ncbi:MAG: DUF6326 family protein [Sediminibacterium sp.]|nr:DUF6326 family protein [Sediminibacterium sp.]